MTSNSQTNPSTRCAECGGMGRVTTAVNTGPVGSGYYRDDICPECLGDGEVEALCLVCDGPLDARGWCADCEDVGLTETQGDPMRNAA